MESESVGQGTRVAVVFSGLVLLGIGVSSVISDLSAAKAPPPPPAAVAQLPAAEPAVAAPPAAAPTDASASPAVSPSPGPAASEIAPAELKNLLLAWRNAWASRDAAAYIGFYAPEFHGTADTPEQWRANRKRIIGQAKFIEIQIGQADISLEGDDLATITFPFDYASDRLKDHGTKVLHVRRNNGQWVIEQEVFTAG